ncbi:hypothetical protein ScPMuIL_000819 [Solemya velum]
MVNIAVLGAGVVGMSTAVCIQNQIPGARITVYADRFAKDTTSDGAAGIFAPMMKKVKTKTKEEFRKYIEDSFTWFDAICRSVDGPEAGIQKISGNDVMLKREEWPLLSNIVYNFREMTEKELSTYPDHIRYGWAFTTVMVECRKYLPWLMRRFRERGGQVVFGTIDSLQQFSTGYDAVVNCLALGSREVFNDRTMYADRGHVLRVHAPWMKHFLIVSMPGGDQTYIFPGQENVVLGGTHQKGQEGMDYDDKIAEDIVGRVAQYVPAMKKAPIERKWVGLRPCRTEVRVEKEICRVGDKSVKVVHNYGHAGQGICLSWGTAIRATELVRELLHNSPTRRQSKL